jgi:hypothetical protein
MLGHLYMTKVAVDWTDPAEVQQFRAGAEKAYSDAVKSKDFAGINEALNRIRTYEHKTKQKMVPKDGYDGLLRVMRMLHVDAVRTRDATKLSALQDQIEFLESHTNKKWESPNVNARGKGPSGGTLPDPKAPAPTPAPKPAAPAPPATGSSAAPKTPMVDSGKFKELKERLKAEAKAKLGPGPVAPASPAAPPPPPGGGTAAKVPPAPARGGAGAPPAPPGGGTPAPRSRAAAPPPPPKPPVAAPLGGGPKPPSGGTAPRSRRGFGALMRGALPYAGAFAAGGAAGYGAKSYLGPTSKSDSTETTAEKPGMLDQVTNYVKENPWTSAGIGVGAAGTTALLAYLLSQGKKPDERPDMAEDVVLA